jgi:hypothetical protein
MGATREFEGVGGAWVLACILTPAALPLATATPKERKKKLIHTVQDNPLSTPQRALPQQRALLVLRQRLDGVLGNVGPACGAGA